MIANDKIYEYDYIDEEMAKMRDEALKKFIYDGTTEKMTFMDLGLYLNNNSLIDQIESVINKSYFDPNITLTESQIEILNILEENNLFLSAPTSFGKTFIVLEYILRHSNLRNIVFIVPTLALMNELLKKIYVKFGDKYNICINGQEKIEDKNIFIFVPERSDNNFIRKLNEIGLDLLIIDEIYKLKPKDKRELKKDDRIILMNKVYLDLVHVAKKIILLGPFIKQIFFNNTKLDIVRYYTNFSPVYNCIHKCCNEKWIEYMKRDKELVYFNSPKSIYKSLDLIIARFPEKNEYIEKYKNEISYLEEFFMKNWYGIKLLKRGIGIHHGKIPMFLRKFYEEEYRNGNLKCLLCTSTLMEGINTPTMRMLVVDNPGTIFKLNNLIGRVGRLNIKSPASGDIYLFSKKTCDYVSHKEKWETLTILSEDKNITSEDEILFFNKIQKDVEKKEEYCRKISTISLATNRSENELKKYDIRIDVAYRFAQGNYKSRFLRVKSIKECVKLTYELLENISYKFAKDTFDNINYSLPILPYLEFTIMIIKGTTFNKIIHWFENKNGNLSEKNSNLLLDELFELKSFIKFKLSKIINYFELFNMECLNDYLRMFVANLKKINDLSITDKIFTDLGIEEIDFQKIAKFLPSNEIVSTSDVIKILKNNKNKLFKMSISPFTKRNINSFYQ